MYGALCNLKYIFCFVFLKVYAVKERERKNGNEEDETHMFGDENQQNDFFVYELRTKKLTCN